MAKFLPTAAGSKLLTTAPRGNALCFPGTTLVKGSHASWAVTTALTFEAWVCLLPQSNTQQMCLWQHGTNSSSVASCLLRPMLAVAGTPAQGYNLAWYNYAVPGAGYLVSTGERLYPNVWAHVAVTYDTALTGGNVKLFVNGNVAGIFTQNTAVPSSPFNILGGFDSDGSVRFSGLVDNLRLWNVARTAAQIQTEMYPLLPTTTSGLVGCFGFDEASGDFLDVSGTSTALAVDGGTAATNPARQGSTAPIAPLGTPKLLTV